MTTPIKRNKVPTTRATPPTRATAAGTGQQSYRKPKPKPSPRTRSKTKPSPKPTQKAERGVGWMSFVRWDGPVQLPGVAFVKAGKRKIDGRTYDVFQLKVIDLGAPTDDGTLRLIICVGKEGKAVKTFKPEQWEA